MQYRIDANEVRRAWRAIVPSGGTIELRALDAIVDGDRRPGTFSGYFNDVEKLIEALGRIRTAKGIYLTPNEVNRALLARSTNRARIVFKEPTTGDADIVRRRWLLVRG